MKSKTDLVVVNTTLASKAAARRLADAIVKAGLAACAQYFPIHSNYRWKGQLTSSSEYLLLAKTRARHARQLMAFIKNNHPYELPEILVTPVLLSFSKYQDWVAQATTGRSG